MTQKIYKISFILAAALWGGAVHAQVVTSDKNYVHEIIPQQPVTINNVNSVGTDDLPLSERHIQTVSYFDGLGRLNQQIGIKASPNQKDMVTHIEYDAYGRRAKEYLPFERQNGSLGSFNPVNVDTDINSYYLNTYPEDFPGITNTGEVNAYSERVFENSPLHRVREQGAPGLAWKANPSSNADHTIKFEWDVNTTTDAISYFKVNFPSGNREIPVLVKDENYTSQELYKTITKDENWTSSDGRNRTTEEYKDKLGRIIIKRAFANVSGVSEAHDTYYVYDDYGNLTYVIPPKVDVSDGVSATELTELCYEYHYDSRNRLIEKKIPGKGWEYIVYNILDQPILTQDANLRKVNSGKSYDYWLYTKYDALGRVAYTGKLVNNSTRKILQSRAHSTSYESYEVRDETPFTIQGVEIFYTKNAYPTSMQTIYTMNYYDNYDFDIVGLENPGTVYGEAVSHRTRSLPTGAKIRVLGTNEWITTVTYYDKKGRPIYVATKNTYLQTTDIIETKLDFAGKVLETKTTHTKGSNAPIVTIDTFTYDQVGRVLSQVQKINNQAPETIVNNSYDALGQLTQKTVGGGLQDVHYTYNVRGWLTKINDPTASLGNDLFAFKINYNTTTENLYAVPLYNGNISETIWKTANDNTQRAYGYRYDALNRFVAANDHENKYVVSSIGYDKMGNIVSIARNGWQNTTGYGNMDVLAYTYDSGNKLLKVADSGNDNYGFKDGANTNDDFEYDANGNMILDRNKGVTNITYNHLNLPEEVSVSGNGHTGNITYFYDAVGVKQKKVVTEGSTVTTTEYAGNYIYKNNNLEFFNHPEGIVEKEADGYKYVYQFKDHLDNIRLSYKDANKDGSITQNEIVQEKNYYPFGLTHKGYNEVLRGRNHTFGFTNKEEQDEIGLGWIDITARNYDPALGRWMNLDPLAEQMRRHSPYNYGFDNPIYFMDPDGMAPFTDIYNLDGKHVKHIEDGSDKKRIALTKSTEEADIDKAISDNHVIDAPSHDVVNKLDKTFEKTEADENEHGFVVATDGSSSKIVTDGKKGKLKESLNKEIFEMTKTRKVAYDVHSHPTGDITDDDGDGVYDIPGGTDASTPDKDGMKNRTQPSIILANKVNISSKNSQMRAGNSSNNRTTISKTKVITFYNSSGTIKTVNFRKFKKAVRKINKN